MKDLYAELFAANREYQEALRLAKAAGVIYEQATDEVERAAQKLTEAAQALYHPDPAWLVEARARYDAEHGRVGYQESDAS